MKKPRQQDQTLIVCPNCGGFSIKSYVSDHLIQVKCQHFLLNGTMCSWSEEIKKTPVETFDYKTNHLVKTIKTPMQIDLYMDTYFFDKSKFNKYAKRNGAKGEGSLNVRCWDMNGHNYIFKGDSAKEILLTQAKGIPFKARISFVNMKVDKSKNPNIHMRTLKNFTETVTQFVKLVEIVGPPVQYPPGVVMPAEYVAPEKDEDVDDISVAIPQFNTNQIIWTTSNIIAVK